MNLPTLTPERIQLSRRKGWKMPPNTVKVDRTTIYGNPFSVETHGRAAAIAHFARFARGELLTDQRAIAEAYAFEEKHCGAPSMHPYTVDELRAALHGKNLACWCPIGSPCHADVLLELANRDQP